MNRIKKFIGLMAFSLMILGLPAIASAQWRDNGRYGNGQYGGYGNGQYGGYGNGQYGGYGDMRSTVRDLKRKSDQFLKQVDRELDRSRRYNGTQLEDRFMGTVRDFENAIDRLNSGNGRQDSGEVNRVLSLGSQIDRSMSRMRLSGPSTQLWNAIEYDLNNLANAYGYNNGYNNGRRNRGWGNGRGNGNNMPSWWPF